MTVLHIVNGDSMMVKLKALTPGEDILVWREALYEGPIVLDLANEHVRQERASYFAETMGLSEAEFRRQNEEQYKALTEHGAYYEIILWFEHDLFDQTILIYLLDWFSKHKAPQTKLQLLCIGEFPGIELFTGLGQLTTEQLATLMGSWHEVTPEELQTASRAWNAYASPDPTEIVRLLKEDLSPLPFLREAFFCHLGRFPSLLNGLGRVEHKTLQFLSEGVVKLVPLFQQISQTENHYGLGDMQYWRYLERLGSGNHPLIRWEGPALLPRLDNLIQLNMEEWTFEITDAGKTILLNQADAIEINGINRCLGGILLTEAMPMWRWDEGNKKLCLK
jgi:hypothetical protein